MKDITRFINEELKPRIYGYIPQIFPELHFTKKGSKYVSSLHADGTEGTGRKEDRSVVTEKYPTKVFDNTRQEPKDVITLYMENNHITEVWEAAYKIADIIGIPRPEYNPTPEQKERYRQQEQRRTALESSAERQVHALFSPEGKKVLDYLRSIGFTEEDLQVVREKGMLGMITESEANNIKAQRSVGDFYTLSIPLRSGVNLYGFKFRTIQEELNGRDKYTYLYGTEKKGTLFNLPGIQKDNGSIVVVEGEIDSIHATARKIEEVVATGGGKLTEEMLDQAIGRGIKRITLLFDKDEMGAKFLRESIDMAHKRGISVLVATFPDGEKLPNGKEIHDINEYLRIHTGEELRSLINNAIYGSKYLLEDLVQSTIKECGGQITDAIEIDLRNKVISLANHAPNEVERDMVLSQYTNLVNIDGKQAFTKQSLKALADRERKADGILEINKNTGKIIQVDKDLCEKEGTEQAKEALKEASLNILDGKGEKGTIESLDSFQDALNVIGAEEEKINALHTIRSLCPSIISNLGEGTILEDISKLRKAARILKKSNRDNVFSQILKDNTEELYNSYKDKADALNSKFELYHQEGSTFKSFKLSFPSGAISTIGAATGNGKSKILQSIALDSLDSLMEGESILYVTYEENEQNVNIQFENSFFNDILTTEYGKGSNLTTITDWLTKGETRYMKNETKEKFFQKEEEWKNLRRSGKIKIVKPEDNYLETLIALIEFAIKNLKIRAIFLDYVQEIYVENWSLYSRSDELKKAMVELDAIAQKTKLPIIMGAQLSREAASPLELNNQCIADSAWIERKSSEIILVWSSTEKIRGKSVKEIEEKKKKVTEEIPGFTIGTPGTLYFLLTKSRMIPKNSTAIVDINSNTGKVSQKLKEQPKTKSNQSKIIWSVLPEPGGRKVDDNNAVVDPETQRPFRRERDQEEITEDLPF